MLQPGGAEGAVPPTAKLENCFSMRLLPHAGQTTFVDAYTSASKRSWQVSHTYS